MTIKINVDERVTFVGATGSGKTYLAKHFLQHQNRCLVIDPKHTFRLNGYGTRRPLFGDSFRVIYRPDDDAKLAKYIFSLWSEGDVTIYCDELATLSERFPESTETLGDVARTGREKRVSLWVALQRPRWVPRIFFTEAEVFFIFRLRSGDDRKYLAEFAGEEVIERINKYDFFYVRADDGDPELLKLDARSGLIYPVPQKLTEV